MSSWWDYPKARPRRVEDGIQARKGRKGFATRWWAQRWLAALERFTSPGRLQRGRTYARQGQVIDYAVAPGSVTARVQGSRKDPYRVSLQLRVFTDEEWAAALEAMAEQAAFAADLLAGRMPETIETAFETARVSLMPASRRDLATRCSCPDDANPCKHIAAVHCLLAEAFDDDPFLLFRLRGRTREQVMEVLGRLWGGGEEEQAEAAPAAEPLPDDPTAFWGRAGAPPALDFGEPALWGSHLLALGPPGSWAGPDDLRGTLAPLLQEMAARARDVMGLDFATEEPTPEPKRRTRRKVDELATGLGAPAETPKPAGKARRRTPAEPSRRRPPRST